MLEKHINGYIVNSRIRFWKVTIMVNSHFEFLQ